METLTNTLLPMPIDSSNFFASHPWIPVALLMFAILWVLPWKGVALWKAARLGHKAWFIVLLVINTMSILEIIYVLLIARRYTVTEEKTGETK
jgi:Mg2+/citrate symporter